MPVPPADVDDARTHMASPTKGGKRRARCTQRWRREPRMDTQVTNDEWLEDKGIAKDPGTTPTSGAPMTADRPRTPPPGGSRNRSPHPDAVDLDAPERGDGGAPPSAVPTDKGIDDSGDDAAGDGAQRSDSAATTDCAADGDGEDQVGGTRRSRRFTPWVAGAFAATVATAVLVTAVGTNLLGSSDPAPVTQPGKSSTAAHPVAAAPPPSTAAEAADQPLPFTAAADCPAGSTTAQSLADPDKPTPWICIRHTDGQPLSITLGPAGMERSYVITAVSIVPGDTTAAQGSTTEPWLNHRVVTRLQWQFNDVANTVLTQSTGNIHGEAVLPVPRVNASKITVLIQETSRPTATVGSSPTSGPPGLFDGILTPQAPAGTSEPVPASDPQQPDPSDTTFAVTSIKIIGHRAL